jgi:hypothetical protein
LLLEAAIRVPGSLGGVGVGFTAGAIALDCWACRQPTEDAPGFEAVVQDPTIRGDGRALRRVADRAAAIFFLAGETSIVRAIILLS